MTYQVLARKWRPQDFASLVGQEHVVTALGNGLKEGRIAQAYLFSGIRGVGKTTAARVLAKALNCEKGPRENPCNECASCLEITEGHSLDVIEVDAATYSKVEQVRELTETLRYGPARGKYKVVVLDEVHRLSRQAFDALLKIVEEPPAHLVFIFATTEIDAVPATILSRCQEFQFRRVPSPVLAGHLRTLCDAEQITASDAALRMIARAGEGSVRDSVALLDQMSTFGSGTISDQDAQQLLGGLDTAIFQKLIAAILEGHGLEVVATVKEIEANGWDPHNVYSQFLVFLRDALHLAMGGDSSGIDLPEEESSRLLSTVKPHGYEPLLQILQLLIESEGHVKRSEMSLLALEIAWLRAAELPKVRRIQDLLSGVDSGGGSPPTGAPSGGGGPRRSDGATTARALPADAPPAKNLTSRRPITEPPEPFLESDAVAEQQDPPDASHEPESQQAESGEPGGEDQGETMLTCDPARLPDLLELLGSRRQSLAAHFQNASLRFDRRTLLIASDDRLLANALLRPANVTALEEALGAIWGRDTDWRIDASGAKSPSAKGSAGAAQNGSRPRNETPPTSEVPVDRATWSSDFQPGDQLPSHRPSIDRPPDMGPPNGSQLAPAWQAPDWDRGGHGGRALPEDQVKEVTGQPVVRSVLDIFGGKIQRIEERTEETSGESPE